MHKKSKKTPSTRKPYTFKRVSENLYKVIETGGYYALVKRGSKQIRRSLKTTDKALATPAELTPICKNNTASASPSVAQGKNDPARGVLTFVGLIGNPRLGCNPRSPR